MSPLLEVRSVTKRFAGVTALSDVSFDVEAGEILAVVGPNGSGKTTTFGTISGFHRPTSGTIVFDGQRIDRKRPPAVDKAGLSRTFQQAMACGTFTARQPLAAAPQVLSSPTRSSPRSGTSAGSARRSSAEASSRWSRSRAR